MTHKNKMKYNFSEESVIMVKKQLKNLSPNKIQAIKPFLNQRRGKSKFQSKNTHKVMQLVKYEQRKQDLM